MSRSYTFSEPMLLQPVFKENVKKQDFTSIVLKGDRYKHFLKNIDRLSKKDIKEISKKKHQLPKLETVINCGNEKVLPEIIKMFYPQDIQGNDDDRDENEYRVKRKQQLPRIQAKKSIQDVLLTQCAKKDSFFEFKKNKNKMLSLSIHNKTKYRSKTLPSSPPKQLQKLKAKHFSTIKRPINLRQLSSIPRSQKTITQFHTLGDQQSQQDQLPSYSSIPRRRHNQFQTILQDFSSASQYNFPPLKLFKVLKCLDKSTRQLQKQMQEQVIQQQKIHFDRKFDRMLQNQQFTYKKHLNRLRQFNMMRKRTNDFIRNQ